MKAKKISKTNLTNNNILQILLIMIFVSAVFLLGSGRFVFVGSKVSNQRNQMAISARPTSVIPTHKPIVTLMPSLIPISPTNSPFKIETWKPYGDVFTINIPNTLSVSAADGGIGRQVWISSDNYLVTINCGNEISKIDTTNYTPTTVNVGNRSGIKVVDDNYVKILIKGLVDSKKRTTSILIMYDIDQADNGEIAKMLKSIVFHPTQSELRDAKPLK